MDAKGLTETSLEADGHALAVGSAHTVGVRVIATVREGDDEADGLGVDDKEGREDGETTIDFEAYEFDGVGEALRLPVTLLDADNDADAHADNAPEIERAFV